ncbi:MAG: serine/threonine-protein kinase [Victivallales bacterium]|nr:serine/threonine-protein kinase [Victivallales bacterium]
MKKVSGEALQEQWLNEGSIDHASYLSASDLHDDAVESETALMITPPEEIESAEKLDESVENLTVKPPDKYKFIRSVGFGGMKGIIKVNDQDTARDVAMAIIPDFDERPQPDIDRFVREARIIARLEHPNIVPIHDIGRDGKGAPYFTMKYLRGHTLATTLRKLNTGDADTLEQYPLARLLRIFVKVANAIAFAHSKRIIHLDLKPENVHIGDFGEVLVLDWGLAKFIGSNDIYDEIEDNRTKDYENKLNRPQTMMTLDGVAKGTPGYMAPEQAAGKNQEKDERTDIYALGCILYAILTFENPLGNRRDVRKMLHDTVVGNIESPSQLKNPARPIPAPLEAICLKAMNLLPDDRYQNVSDLRNDIFAFMTGYATTAENASTIKKTFLFINRNWLPLLFSLTLALLLLLSGLLILACYRGFITINI